MEDPIPIAELCVKSIEWSNEQEVRVVRSFSSCKKKGEFKGYPLYLMDIPLGCIISVTLGERTPIKDQRKVWNAIKDTNIGLKLATIANWKYEFRTEIIKYNKPVSELAPMISPRTAHIFSNLKGELGDCARYLIKNHNMSEIANETL